MACCNLHWNFAKRSCGRSAVFAQKLLSLETPPWYGPVTDISITQITGLRAIMSTFGTILGGGAAMLLSSFSDEVFGLRTITIGFGLFTLISLLIAARSVRDVEDAASTRAAIIEFSIPRYLQVVKEPNVLVLLALKFLGAIATGSLSAALPYFAEHILGDPGQSTKGLAIYVALSALVLPVWSKLTQRFDKRRLLLAGNVATALVLLAVGLFVGEGSVLTVTV